MVFCNILQLYSKLVEPTWHCINFQAQFGQFEVILDVPVRMEVLKPAADVATV